MIRPATKADVPQLVELGLAMLTESPRFSRLSFSGERLTQTLQALLEQRQFVMVAEDWRAGGGRLVGVMVAIVSQHWASDDLVASDLALFVEPEVRGGLLAARLVTRYVQWAQERGAVLIQQGVTTGVETETTARLLERLGLKRCGVILEA